MSDTFEGGLCGEFDSFCGDESSLCHSRMINFIKLRALAEKRIKF